MNHTFILRHRKENLKKCTLSGLEQDDSFSFYSYPSDRLTNLKNTCLLTLNAPDLTFADRQYNLLLIDGTWQYAQKMEKVTLHNNPQLILRQIPQTIVTAYPRKQTGCLKPKQGLASIEALAIAYYILGFPWLHLLDHYYWRQDFLAFNEVAMKALVPPQKS